MGNADRNCLSFWFPKLEAAGLPVPKTVILRSPDLLPLLDGMCPKGYGDFWVATKRAAEAIGGFPVFLRTGQGSGKHDWKRTCYVPSLDELSSHVAALVEWSEIVDFMGLAHDVWAIRELLPTSPVCTLPRYGNMPLCCEFRCFVRDAEVLCVHPYWPWESVEHGFPFKPEKGWDDDPEHDVPPGMRGKWEHIVSLGPEDAEAVRNLASQAGEAVGGEWSVDILDTQRGWYVTDMAEAAQSWHWPDCPHNVKNWA